MNEILSQHGIELMLVLILFYFAFKVLVLKDVDAIRPKQWGPIKDEHRDAYCKETGILLILFGICIIFMNVVLHIEPSLGLMFMMLAMVIVFWRFKKIEEKYGNGKNQNP
jgi:hypothetical protein